MQFLKSPIEKCKNWREKSSLKTAFKYTWDWQVNCNCPWWEKIQGDGVNTCLFSHTHWLKVINSLKAKGKRWSTRCLVHYAPATSSYYLEQSTIKQVFLKLTSPVSYPIYPRCPKLYNTSMYLCQMRKEKPVAVSHCYPISLPCSILCLLSPNPKQIPAAILSILPALALAPRWYVLTTKHFSCKMEKTGTLKIWNKLAAHI